MKFVTFCVVWRSQDSWIVNRLRKLKDHHCRKVKKSLPFANREHFLWINKSVVYDKLVNNQSYCSIIISTDMICVKNKNEWTINLISRLLRQSPKLQKCFTLPQLKPLAFRSLSSRLPFIRFSILICSRFLKFTNQFRKKTKWKWAEWDKNQKLRRKERDGENFDISRGLFWVLNSSFRVEESFRCCFFSSWLTVKFKVAKSLACIFHFWQIIANEKKFKIHSSSIIKKSLH